MEMNDFFNFDLTFIANTFLKMSTCFCFIMGTFTTIYLRPITELSRKFEMRPTMGFWAVLEAMGPKDNSFIKRKFLVAIFTCSFKPK